MIFYQKSTVKEAPLLAHTRQKVWAATYRGILPDEMIDHFDYVLHTAREEKNLQNPMYYTYLVMDGEECCGYFTYIHSSVPLWREYYCRLLSLYLLPQQQKQGQGRLIFEFVAAQCKNLGCDKFYLSCDPQNTNALLFYKHMGCKVVCENLNHEHAYEDSIELEFLTKED